MKSLQSYLMPLGHAKLIEILGSEFATEVEALAGKLTERTLASLVEARFGVGAFAEKLLRRAILVSLSPDKVVAIASLSGMPHRNTHEALVEEIVKAPWTSNSRLPRAFVDVLELSTEFIPQPYVAAPDTQEVIPTFELFEHQRRIRTRLSQTLETEGSRCLVHMPTGSGKTRTALEAISDFWRRDPSGYVIWLAHSEELCEQAIATWAEVWTRRGDQKINLIRFWGQHFPDLRNYMNGIMVGGLQKLYSCLTGSGEAFDQMRQIQDRARLVIVDEAHRALAPTYKAVIESLLLGNGRPRLVGLTATPGRTTSNDSEENTNLVTLFGGFENRITLQDEHGQNMESPVGYLQKLGFLAKASRVPLMTHLQITPTLEELEFFRRTGDISESILKRIGADSTRNKIVFEEIRRLVASDKKVIVFACSVQQSRLLTMTLIAAGIEAKCIDAQTAKTDRENSVKSFRQRDGGCRVLLNYEVLSTGFDAPATDCIMIARPTTSIVLYSQMLGRGLRGPKVGGNEYCTVVDVIDNIHNFPNEEWAFNYFNTYWSE